MTNFFTPWEDGVTEYKADDMNQPLAELDIAISYLKNASMWCEGNFFYTKAATGVLSWDGYIKFAYLDANGNTITNKVAASSISLDDLEFAYVVLSATDDATITVTKASIVGDAECNFGDGNIVVLALKAGNDDLFMVNLRPKVAYPYDIAGTFGGKPVAGAALLRIPVPRKVIFPADMSESSAVCATSCTESTQVFSIKKDGVEFATITFSNSSYEGVFACPTATTFEPGDVLTLIAPNPQDTTLADIGVCLVAARGF
jgi:hypothetical protein